MRSRRFKETPRNNASKLHRKTWEFLKQYFPTNKIYQEYHVKFVNHTWPDYRAKYDFVIKDLKIVIECHGEQHRREVQWFGRVTDFDTKHKTLKEIQAQDEAKKRAAEEAGYLYIVVWYDQEPQDIIPKELERPHPIPTIGPKEKKKQLVSRKLDKNSEYYKLMKERAREYRKKRYQKQKKWRQSVLQNRKSSPEGRVNTGSEEL